MKVYAAPELWDLAITYGRDEALMIEYLRRWIGFNQSCGKNLHDQRTWTYDSLEKIAERTKIWSVKQVRRILGSLRQQKVIQVGHFAKYWSDRTNWYAFCDEVAFLGTQAVEKVKERVSGPKEKSFVSDRFAEQVAEVYNRLLSSKVPKADPKNPRFQAMCRGLRKKRPGTTLAEIEAGILRLAGQVSQDRAKASLLRWKSLLHPNVLGRILEQLKTGPPEPPSAVKKQASMEYKRKIAEACTKALPDFVAPDLEDQVFCALCDDLYNLWGADSLRLKMAVFAIEEASNWVWNSATFTWKELLKLERLQRLFDARMKREGQAAESSEGTAELEEGDIIEVRPQSEEAEQDRGLPFQQRFEEKLTQLANQLDMNHMLQPGERP